MIFSNVFKQGKAQRVRFFYPEEPGSFIENVDVTIYTNGLVHFIGNGEETTLHISMVEIQWSVIDREMSYVSLGKEEE